MSGSKERNGLAGTTVIHQNGKPPQSVATGTQSMAEYRAIARKKLLPQGYSGYMHLFYLFGTCTAIMSICVWWMERLTWLDWLSIPVFMSIANAYEYAVHRYPGHVTLSPQPFRYFHKSHTGLHHRFFTYENFQPDLGHVDYYFALFPLRVYATWFLTATLPVTLVGRYYLPWNICLIAACVGSFYLVLYEVLHSYAHESLPRAMLSVVSYIPGADFVREHHRLHHHPRLMTSCNFNLTFPLTDWLVGTLVTKLPAS
ncbi:uncharacterized protein LOC135809723 [Sycon ciliatum]|uniref:uncharacterized protein LOC135809723 n=1 Tax=Sycon ciliatum TaxID=27933 RepID=UPI0020ADEE8A|eukprot:scpid74926/ scgid18241/ 